jgi:hypothetical protein
MLTLDILVSLYHNQGMPKRSSRKHDDQQAEPDSSAQPVPELTPDGKNPAAVALGRLGGKKGGPARAKKLTKEQRAEIARKAAQARWEKAKGQNT